MKRTQKAKALHNSDQSKLAGSQSNQQQTAQVTTIVMPPRSRVVSFRLAAEQYSELVTRCQNSHGEQLLTPSEYARHNVMHQRVAQPSELPMERYRLAIAAQLATAITDIAQGLDSIKMLTFKAQIERLTEACEKMAQIQNQIKVLLNIN